MRVNGGGGNKFWEVTAFFVGVTRVEFGQPLRSQREVVAVRDALERRCLRDGGLFVLGTNTGLRISDLLRLRVSDVLTPGARRRQVASRLQMREKKTGKAKDIPLNAACRSPLW